MSAQEKWNQEWFSGLTALVETTFPKKCTTCGRMFETAEQFLAETEEIHPQRSGLKKTVDEDDTTEILELYRNCPCGSTLMDFFKNRRDESEAGLVRRLKFRELLNFLTDSGLDHATARSELLKVLHGEKSEILARIKSAK